MSTSLRTITTAAALATGVLSAPSASAAADMFLKVGTGTGAIQGESSDAKHKNEIDVLAWSWGLVQSGASSAKSVGACVQDISVTKYIDAATPGLMIALTVGQKLGEATLTVRKAGEAPLEFLVLKMQDVEVTSVDTGILAGGNDQLVESVSLSFSYVDWQYTKQNPDGTAGAQQTARIYSDKTGCK